MMKAYVRKNILYISIIIFLILFYILVLTKPTFLFDNDGSVKHFGVGHTTKTVLPLWFIALCLGILSYMMVLYYLILS